MKHGLLALTALTFTLTIPAQQDKAPAVDFEKQIWPILEKRCIECHSTAHTGPDGKIRKPKGGVVLDTRDGITGSKRGKLVKPKDAANSLLVEAISLPADDEDRMPPAKKGDPLSKQQIELITRWIDGGADFGKWIGKAKGKTDEPKGGEQTEKGAEPKNGGGAKAKAGESHAQALQRLQKGLSPVPAATLEALAGSPFAVASIGEGSPLLRIGCAGHTDEVDDDALAELEPIAQYITELDLGRSNVGDEGCKRIAKMPRLTALDLRQTQVGDYGAAALAACKELRSLNLFGTKTGDYGAAALASLKHLEHVYVWQTEVSAAAVVRLRESVPGARVVFAAELPEPMAEGAAGRRRR